MGNTEIVLGIISITILALVLVSAIGLVVVRSVKQKSKMEMEMAQDKLNYEQELRKVETEVSEETMRQVGAELHDNIAQMLTVIHLQIENQKLDHPTLEEVFKKMGNNLAEVTQQVRLLSRTLNNDYLNHIGLISAINTEVNRLKTLRKYEVHWNPVKGDSNLDKNQELMAFRVFQETVQNALRHSAAKNFFITVQNDNGNFELKLEDDGKGFDFEGMMQSDRASGLRNIIKRTKWAGMECTIESEPGKGCVTTLKKHV